MPNRDKFNSSNRGGYSSNDRDLTSQARYNSQEQYNEQQGGYRAQGDDNMSGNDFGTGRNYQNDDHGNNTNMSGPMRGDEQGFGRGSANMNSRISQGNSSYPSRGRYSYGDDSHLDTPGSSGFGANMQGERYGSNVSSSYGQSYQPAGMRGRAPYQYQREDYPARFADDHKRGMWDRASDEVSSWFGNEEATNRRQMDEMRDKSHYGKGPSNYTRSDDRIKEDVSDTLSEDWHIDASEIEVAVDEGEVTLSGTVQNRHDKRHAEDIIEDLSGVRHVQNNLRVSQTGEKGSTKISSLQNNNMNKRKSA